MADLITEVTSDIPGGIRRISGDEAPEGYVDEEDNDEADEIEEDMDSEN